MARNASEIWKLDRFRRTIRASSSEDLSHCLSDTSQSTRCGRCSSTSFQRAFTNLCRFREDSTFSTWVTRIAINDALMLLRQRRAKTRLQENNDGAEAPSVLDSADKGPTPEQALVENELRVAVIHAISRLHKSLRIVVLLRELLGLTSAETARRLGLTVSAVKARTSRARRSLRKYLEPKYEAAGGGFRSERGV
jgi:RNA polymerase sigma-70 factor, ECF subfamily